MIYTEYLAHIREDGTEQTVLEHLRGTAELCREFAAQFGAGEQGYLAGLTHDLGKYSSEFQKRILCGGPKVDHSTAGAYECLLRRQPYAAFAVAGHHGGLPDGGSRTDSADLPTLQGRMNRALKKRIPEYAHWSTELSLPKSTDLKELPPDNRSEDFFVRMLYSCLTDADWLDTERFMSDGDAVRDSGESIAALCEKLDAYVEKWFPPRTELNRQRCAILSKCISRGDDSAQKSGLFTLTVPTGGGKTVASLAFALHHAKVHGKSRVIYVIPYTSIIEQTADVFRGILGEDNVLEHHSGVVIDEDEEASPQIIKLRRAAENWDKPVVVTTAVQFFESIYSNRSSRCRKNHNLANSVIVFDEAQLLPLPYLRPCVSAISQLIQSYGVSAVLCTATQPALDSLIREFLPAETVTELCPKTTYDLEQFRRVSFKTSGELSWEQIAEEMLETSQSLCIVNTTKSAARLYNLMEGKDGTFHLSAMMVPAHRREVLKEIRARLNAGLPCRVAATSLIEAGVDVDFPAVFREIAGLDSMLQAAGRCNREGRRRAQESVVTMFKSECPVPPLFEMNADIGKQAIAQFSDISSDAAISFYFKELLLLTGKEAQDYKGILPMIESGTFPFASVAERFHLIDTDTRTVYIPWREGAELIERLKSGERSKALFRAAAQYSVSVYEQHFKNLLASGAIAPIDGQSGLWYLQADDKYSEAVGLCADGDGAKGIFV